MQTKKVQDPPVEEAEAIELQVVELVPAQDLIDGAEI